MHQLIAERRYLRRRFVRILLLGHRFGDVDNIGRGPLPGRHKFFDQARRSGLRKDRRRSDCRALHRELMARGHALVPSADDRPHPRATRSSWPGAGSAIAKLHWRMWPTPASSRPPRRRRPRPWASSGCRCPTAPRRAPAQAGAKEALVQEGPEMADRLRRTHEPAEAAPWPQPLPLQGDAGMKRWVGLGVIGDNLINLGIALARSKTPS